MVKTVCETHFANHDLAADNTEHEMNDKRASFDIDRKCPAALMHAGVSKKNGKTNRNLRPKHEYAPTVVITMERKAPFTRS
jgi:hypothetical protein